MIPRYAPADMAALFSDTARFSLWLEVELAGHRGTGRRRRGAGRGRRHLPGQGPDGRRRLRRRRARTREGHGPRRGRLRRRGAGAHRRSGRIAHPLRAHLVGRGGHRAVRHAHPGGRPAAGRPRRLRGRTQGAGARAPARAGHGPHARHARRADDVRGQVRAVGPAGRPRPAPPAGRPRRHRRGQALGRGRHVLQHRSRGGGQRLRRARPDAGAGHPGHRPRPPRRVLLRLRRRRLDH